MLSCVRLFATPWTVAGSARLLCPWDSPGKNTFVLEVSFVLEVAFVLESRKEVAEKCFGMSPFIESSKRPKQYMYV